MKIVLVSEVFVYFFRLGIVGFGGPLALVATMQRDLVEKRGWMKEEDFVRAFALIKAMPGPVAFQAAVFLGRHRAGWKGGLAAAIGLNFTAFVLMVLFGVFYANLREFSAVQSFMVGMQAAALGVILASLKGMFWPHRKKLIFWVFAAVAIGVTFSFPAWEPVLIISSGIITALLSILRNRSSWAPLKRLKLSIAAPFFVGSAASVPVLNSELGQLVWACFKAGAFVFGSGLAIVPIMEHDFVRDLGWLSHQEFMDALAFGQVTPGPVVITATFIGFKRLGLIGALAGTMAIFAASFFHMMTWFPPLVNRLSKLSWISAFLTGAIAAVVGSIAATVVRLSMDWVGQPLPYILIASVLLGALFTKLPAWSLIPIGGAASWLVSLIH